MKKMKNFIKWFVTLVFIVLMIVLFKVLNTIDYNKATEVKLESDSIATINTVVGDRKVVSVKTEKSGNNGTKKILKYEAKAVTAEDLDNYVLDLQRRGFIATMTFTDNKGQLGIESNEIGYTILVDIEYSEDGSIISYTKAYGGLNRGKQ